MPSDSTCVRRRASCARSRESPARGDRRDYAGHRGVGAGRQARRLVAVIGDLLASGDPEARVRAFLDRCTGVRPGRPHAKWRADMIRIVMAAWVMATMTAARMRAQQPATPAAIELPKPSGPYPVATTSWRITDPTRKETFSAAGDPRQVEVIAWYPAAAPRRTGALAPYLREGCRRCARSPPCCGPRARRSTRLKSAPTHAELDAAPRVGPRQAAPCWCSRPEYTGFRARTPRCSRIWRATDTPC